MIGWSLASLYWNYAAYNGAGFSYTLAIIHFIADLAIYIPLTHAYRLFARSHRWQLLGQKSLIIRLVPAILVLGFAFMVLTICKNYTVALLAGPGVAGSLRYTFETLGLSIFVTGIRMMAIWILAYHGYHFAQREINAVKEAARLTSIAKDAAFNNLSAQLNPHFFFNSLNSIKALVAEDPNAARRAIDLLSELLRNSLYNGNTSLISVNDELLVTKDYLDLEKIRFEDRLQFMIKTDPAISGQMILPLSIQVLVENAIKHGIAKTKGGGTIYITILQQNGSIQASVQNPGHLTNQQGQGLGLKNLSERLQLQFNGKASLQIKQQSNDTVLATMITPV